MNFEKEITENSKALAGRMAINRIRRRVEGVGAWELQNPVGQSERNWSQGPKEVRPSHRADSLGGCPRGRGSRCKAAVTPTPWKTREGTSEDKQHRNRVYLKGQMVWRVEKNEKT